jgi:5-methylcytosine-specific restriction enzyme A
LHHFHTFHDERTKLETLNQLPFIPNQIYHRRNDIHSVYGGNWQGGICPSSNYPYIFIFTGKSGHQHGYKDGWDNPNIFSYTGEGQSGDMKFVRGNLALKDHIENGNRVFLFEFVRKGYVRFVYELEIFDVDYFETPDTERNIRNGIKFFFTKAGSVVPIQPEKLNRNSLTHEPEIAYATPPNKTERAGLVTSRVGQGAYRKRIIHRWQYKCAVSGYNKLDILIASHILPWADADDTERLDVHNGLLLSPTYDALFDRHLISFDNNGRIILSDTIEKSAFEKIGLSGQERIRDLSSYNQDYLERHRTKYLDLNH